MTFRIMPEFDRYGRASARTGSGGNHNPISNRQRKDFTCLKSGWVLQDTPLSFRKRENQGEGDEGPSHQNIHN